MRDALPPDVRLLSFEPDRQEVGAITARISGAYNDDGDMRPALTLYPYERRATLTSPLSFDASESVIPAALLAANRRLGAGMFSFDGSATLLVTQLYDVDLLHHHALAGCIRHHLLLVPLSESLLEQMVEEKLDPSWFVAALRSATSRWPSHTSKREDYWTPPLFKETPAETPWADTINGNGLTTTATWTGIPAADERSRHVPRSEIVTRADRLTIPTAHRHRVAEFCVTDTSPLDRFGSFAWSPEEEAPVFRTVVHGLHPPAGTSSRRGTRTKSNSSSPRTPSARATLSSDPGRLQHYLRMNHAAYACALPIIRDLATGQVGVGNEH